MEEDSNRGLLIAELTVLYEMLILKWTQRLLQIKCYLRLKYIQLHIFSKHQKMKKTEGVLEALGVLYYLVKRVTYDEGQRMGREIFWSYRHVVLETS